MFIERFDLRRGPGLAGSAGEDLAKHHGQIGTVGLESSKDEFDIAGDHRRARFFLQIIGPRQQYHGGGMQRQHVLLEADQDATGGVAGDATIGHLHGTEGFAQIIAPTLGDGVAQENHRTLVGRHLGSPGRAALIPKLAEPVGTADRAGPWQALIGGGNSQGGAVLGGQPYRRTGQKKQGGEKSECHFLLLWHNPARLAKDFTA